MSDEKSDEKSDDGSTAKTAADSGTTTKMGVPWVGGRGRNQFDKETCIKMWGELNAANDGKVTNYEELGDLMIRNREEYITTGGVVSGKLPFAVQFCTSAWHPALKEAQRIKMRDYFLQMTLEDIYTTFAKGDPQQKRTGFTAHTLKVNLKQLAGGTFKGIATSIAVLPLETFADFMSKHGYEEAAAPR